MGAIPIPGIGYNSVVIYSIESLTMPYSLSEDQVWEIHRIYRHSIMFDTRITRSEIAKKFHCNPSNISLILRGITWAHVKKKFDAKYPISKKYTRKKDKLRYMDVMDIHKIHYDYKSRGEKITYRQLGVIFNVDHRDIGHVLSGSIFPEVKEEFVNMHLSFLRP